MPPWELAEEKLLIHGSRDSALTSLQHPTVPRLWQSHQLLTRSFPENGEFNKPNSSFGPWILYPWKPHSEHRQKEGTSCTSLLRAFSSTLRKFTLQFCHLTWVLLLTHLLAQLTLCPKPSPAWDLSTHPPCSDPNACLLQHSSCWDLGGKLLWERLNIPTFLVWR